MSSRSSSDSPLICVGKLKAPRGLQGELHAIFFSPPEDWIDKVDSFWIGSSDSEGRVYEVARLQAGGSAGYHLRLKGVQTRDQSEALVGAKIFLPEDLFVSEEGEVIFLREILGFDVWDREVVVGPIVGFSSNGPQDLLLVDHGGRQVEIPFVDAFIVDVDFTARKVLMDLPVGLWQEEP